MQAYIHQLRTHPDAVLTDISLAFEPSDMSTPHGEGNLMKSKLNLNEN